MTLVRIFCASLAGKEKKGSTDQPEIRTAIGKKRDETDTHSPDQPTPSSCCGV